MKRNLSVCAGALCLSVCLVMGCDALLGFLPSSVVTVRLINNSDFAVEGELFYDDEDDTIEEVLEETGTRRQFVLVAGGQSQFSVTCDNLRSIIIADADLMIVGGVGPSASSDVLRDGDEFECGDQITFTFDHSGAIVDFDVTIDVDPQQ